MAVDIRDVDPADLRLPGSRASGADPHKLQRQIARLRGIRWGTGARRRGNPSDESCQTVTWNHSSGRSARQTAPAEGPEPPDWGCIMKTTDLIACVLDRLAEVREHCPEMRFGQFLATIGLLAEDETGHSLWEVEDTEFAAALERFAADLARRRVESAESL
jgi:hypothetical protein